MEFYTAEKIIFGIGAISQLGEIASAFGKKALLIHGRNQFFIRKIQEILLKSDLHISEFEVRREPTVGSVSEVSNLARKNKIQVVISVGGGSVIDTGKAVSAMITNTGELMDYLEVVGKGMAIKKRAAPFIAVPTTAGTGSEVTKNAVLSVPDEKVKVSMRSPLMIPRVALLDPNLTLSLPPGVTASTGMDALTQLIEPFISIKANPMVDMFCRDGIRRVMRSLKSAFINGNDIVAREDMCWASLYGGIALANAGLGAAHGFAAPIGGMFSAPHGAVCAILLPRVIKENYEFIKKNKNDLRKFYELATLIKGRSKPDIDESIKMIEELCVDLEIPGLSAYKITTHDFPEIIEKAKVSSSMKGNPVQLMDMELNRILENSL